MWLITVHLEMPMRSTLDPMVTNNRDLMVVIQSFNRNRNIQQLVPLLFHCANAIGFFGPDSNITPFYNRLKSGSLFKHDFNLIFSIFRAFLPVGLEWYSTPPICLITQQFPLKNKICRSASRYSGNQKTFEASTQEWTADLHTIATLPPPPAFSSANWLMVQLHYSSTHLSWVLYGTTVPFL